MINKPRYSSLRDYLAVIRQRRLIVLFVTVVFTGVAIATTVGREPVYESEAALAFREANRDLSAIGLPEFDRLTPEVRAASEAETATRPSVLEGAARRLGTTASLRGKVTARAETRTNFVVLIARDDTARSAARIAQAVADQLVRATRRRERARFDELIDRTRAQLRDIEGRGPLSALRRSEIQSQLVKLETARDVTDPAEVTRDAVVQSSPVEPKPIRTGIIGLVMGLSFGLIAAFLREALDRRLRGTRDIVEEAQMPLLGLVRDGALGKANVGDPVSGRGDEEIDLEAFRIMRTNLEFLDVDRPPRTIVVTSPLPEEGKSTVAASLAVASALSGKRVLLVEADLRRPVLAQRLDIAPEPGLTDFLAGRVAPADVLRPVALTAATTTNGGSPAQTIPGKTLVAIPAGTIVPRPAELLGSERFQNFVRDVAQAYDLVVFDSSPLLPVVDTLEMLRSMDGVVLCVRSEQTTREQLRAAREALGRLPDLPTGLVVTGVRKGGEGEYGYYSYGYASASPS